MTTKAIAMRDAFLNRICQAMKNDYKIFFISADFGSPVLDKIRSDFPKRFVNVGIAEQNLINISAGLALEGYTVFAYAIAPFITMRCFEQIRVSLALLSEVRPMNVNLIGVGAGYSYVVSGPTHQCYEDISIMRALPNLQILSPADHICTDRIFDRCIEMLGPKYLRFDAQVLPVIYKNAMPSLNIGFHVHRQGSEICLLATGYMVHTALKVADALNSSSIKVGVIDLFNITNFDQESLVMSLSNYKGLVTMEEGFRGRGGLDSMMFELIARQRLNLPLLNLGVEGGYRFEQGTREELHEQVGIGPKYVKESIDKFIQTLVTC
jgi:transketolase